jgi:hypothetical protein
MNKPHLCKGLQNLEKLNDRIEISKMSDVVPLLKQFEIWENADSFIYKNKEYELWTPEQIAIFDSLKDDVLEALKKFQEGIKKLEYGSSSRAYVIVLFREIFGEIK